MNTEFSADFWKALDKVVSESRIVIDRLKGNHHPRYPHLVYPVDYGYLEGTSAMDGGGIDVWRGTCGTSLDAVVCTVDLIKKDTELKILIGTSETEKQVILGFHNNSEYMKAIIVLRHDD